ncbi:MAG: hypothetical protein KC912_23450 [Proteobacteria bacterium]|nr:hypothetical protein [Pseudomonadota bacterium]
MDNGILIVTAIVLAGPLLTAAVALAVKPLRKVSVALVPAAGIGVSIWFLGLLIDHGCERTDVIGQLWQLGGSAALAATFCTLAVLRAVIHRDTPSMQASLASGGALLLIQLIAVLGTQRFAFAWTMHCL